MSTPPLTSLEAIHAWELSCTDQEGFYQALGALDQLAAAPDALHIALRGYALWRVDEEVEGVVLLERAASMPDPRAAALAHVRLAHVCMFERDLERALRHVAAAHDLQVTSRWEELAPHLLLMEGRCLSRRLERCAEDERAPLKARMLDALLDAEVAFWQRGDSRRALCALELLVEQLERGESAQLDASVAALAARVDDDPARQVQALRVELCRMRFDEAFERLASARETLSPEGLDELLTWLAFGHAEPPEDSALRCGALALSAPLLPEHEGDWCRILCDEHLSRGEFAQAEALIARGLRVRGLPPYQRALLRLAQAIARFDRGDQALASAALPAEQELEGVADDFMFAERARIEALLWVRRGAVSRAQSILDHALATFTDLDDTSRAALLIDRALVAQLDGQLDDAAARLEEVATLELTPQLRATLASHRGLLAMDLGDQETVQSQLSFAAAHHPHPLQRGVAQCFLARAMEDLDTLDALVAHEQPLIRMLSTYHLGWLTFLEGVDLQRCVEALVQCAEEAAQLGAIAIEAEALFLLALCQDDEGESIALCERAQLLLVALSTFLPDPRERHELLSRLEPVSALLVGLLAEHGEPERALVALYECKSPDLLREHMQRAHLLDQLHIEVPALATLASASAASHAALHGYTLGAQGARLVEQYLDLLRAETLPAPLLTDPRLVQAALGPDEAAIEHLVWDDELRACVIRADGLTWFTHRLDGSFDELLAACMARLRGERGLGSGVSARKLAQELRRLGELLWSPLLPSLEGVRRVILSPSRQLYELPWHALTDAGGRVYGDRFVVEYALSTGQLARAIRAEAPRRALIWQPAQPATAPLPAAEHEREAITRALDARGVEVIHTTQWTEPLMLTADIIHYIGHAWAGHDEPDGPAPEQALDALGSALLPRRPLVILSACETGRALGRGEEVRGIVRDALGAGARAVIVTMWSVHDAVSARVMSALYEALAAGEPAADALDHATRRLRAEATLAHPFYWAAFRCVSGGHLVGDVASAHREGV